MTRSDAAAADVRGVGGARLEQINEHGVACWLSEGGIAADTAAGSSTQDDLLAFHRVVHAFFQGGAVVPFRFPTTLADRDALVAWLQSNAAAVARELERLRGMVQMELHLTVTVAASANKGAAASGGREYLEARRDAQSALRAAAAEARQRAGALAAEWRERETREGLRCYALVARGREREFAAEFAGPAEPASAVGIRVTGPWPPAEFLDPALTRFS